MDATTDAAVRSAQVARTSYGRLVALLAAGTRDLALAEDVLWATHSNLALRTWPSSGVPDNPVGWLLTVARNRLRGVVGSAAARTSMPLYSDDLRLAVLTAVDPDAIPDKRLELLFACAHPAIDRTIRTPLMLNTVLGIDAARIATAFALPRGTVAQRLVARSAGSATIEAGWSPARAAERYASRGGPRRSGRTGTAPKALPGWLTGPRARTPSRTAHRSRWSVGSCTCAGSTGSDRSRSPTGLESALLPLLHGRGAGPHVMSPTIPSEPGAQQGGRS